MTTNVEISNKGPKTVLIGREGEHYESELAPGRYTTIHVWAGTKLYVTEKEEKSGD